MASQGNQESLKNALNIYSWLIKNELFAGKDGDNLAMNSDIVPAYRKLLLVSGDYVGSIEATKTHLDYLRSTGKIDHQIRRGWLEVISIQIGMGDIYALDATLQAFAKDAPNGFAHDEYTVGHDLKQAVQKDDYVQVMSVVKKPIFSFLEAEAVKLLKSVADPKAREQQERDQEIEDPKKIVDPIKKEEEKKEQVFNSFL